MSGILLLKNLNTKNILAQGDNTPLRYELAYADERPFNYSSYPVTVRFHASSLKPAGLNFIVKP